MSDERWPPTGRSGPRPLLYLAPNRWDDLRQRPQHLAAGLAQTRAVIFVEPAAYSALGALRRRLVNHQPISWGSRLRQFSEQLFVFTPAPTLPGSLRLRLVNRLVHRFAWGHLRPVLWRLGYDDFDVVVGWPPAYDLVRYLPARRIIYDCMDLFPDFHPGRRRLLETLEAELARCASAVVVTSRLLERRWSDRHPRIVRIPNGVEVGTFWQDLGSASLPVDLATLPRPRLGYVGTIGRWLDLSLLADLAGRRPECSIVLIGPIERGIKRPAAPLNLYFLGERAYSSLPHYLAGMDALIIPFRLMDLTHAVNPIKLYEYCACGKPIAATPLDEMTVADGLCHLGAGPDAFSSAVDAALREAARPDPARVAARQAVARNASWDRRVAALAALLDTPD